MSVDGSRFDWRRWSELTWRVLVFIVAIAILVIVTTRWNRWQGRRRLAGDGRCVPAGGYHADRREGWWLPPRSSGSGL